VSHLFFPSEFAPHTHLEGVVGVPRGDVRVVEHAVRPGALPCGNPGGAPGAGGSRGDPVPGGRERGASRGQILPPSSVGSILTKSLETYIILSNQSSAPDRPVRPARCLSLNKWQRERERGRGGGGGWANLQRKKLQNICWIEMMSSRKFLPSNESTKTHGASLLGSGGGDRVWTGFDLDRAHKNSTK